MNDWVFTGQEIALLDKFMKFLAEDEFHEEDFGGENERITWIRDFEIWLGKKAHEEEEAIRARDTFDYDRRIGL